MKLYACSISAIRKQTNGNGGIDTQVPHYAFAVEANSKDEAVGISLRIAKKVLPASDGWCSYSANAQDASVILTPENAVICAE